MTQYSHICHALSHMCDGLDCDGLDNVKGISKLFTQYNLFGQDVYETTLGHMGEMQINYCHFIFFPFGHKNGCDG